MNNQLETASKENTLVAVLYGILVFLFFVMISS